MKVTMGEHMKFARKNAKVSRVKLSEISGIPITTIYNNEHDLCFPRLFTVMCLADALKIPLDEYIGRTVPK